jgi:RNA polymerase sigma factor (sigma-70 family)
MDNGASSYRRFLDGDDSGLVEIIRDYKDGLMLYLNGFVGNIHTAEDLTEDVFFKLATKQPSYAGKSSFKTWLYAIGRHAAVDYIRRHARTTLSADVDAASLHDEQALERSYLREERKILVHGALRRLKPAYRQVLWLVYFEGLSHKEAAAVMKKSVHTIDTLVYRARQALKSELDQEGFVYEEL